jgi:uncharacterized protein (TIGR00730 family)
MAKLRSVCVFCGSSPGRHAVYENAAREAGEVIAKSGIRLIYGGGGLGMMGAIARAAMAAGGEVIGVIPHALRRKELAYHQLTHLHVVDTMHERKQLMAELSDGFIAMPGGFGTLEEFSEVITWLQLGIHQKPCGLLNVAGYFDNLIAFMDHAVREGFIKPKYRSNVIVALEANTLLDAFDSFGRARTEDWPSRRNET